VNVLAVAAANTTDKPSPAGLIGRLVVTFESGDPLTCAIDASWRALKTAPAGWMDAAFDDASWPAAEVVGAFGDPPWGRLDGGSRQLTVSPIIADVFAGRCDVPADVDLAKVRAVLVMDDVPQGAAAVTVNGTIAGGVIGGPYRLDVTRLVKAGANTVEIAPLAPKAVRLVFYDKAGGP
jgi:hypothetical protein